MNFSRHLAILPRVRKNHQIVMFASGVVLTVFILALLVFNFDTAIRRYRYDGQQAFARTSVQIADVVYASKIRMRISLAEAENKWMRNLCRQDNLPVIPPLAQKDGFITDKFAFPIGENNKAILLAGSTDHVSVTELKHFSIIAQNISSMVSELSNTMANALELPWRISGYIMPISGSLVGLYPAPSPNLLADRANLFAYYRESLKNLSAWEQTDIQAGKDHRTLRWLPAKPNPLTGVPTFRLAGLAYSGGKPFAVIVGDYPLKFLTDPLAHEAGDYLIVDRNGTAVTPTASKSHDLAMIRDIFLQQPPMQHMSEMQQRGQLITYQQLSDSGWVLVRILPMSAIWGQAVANQMPAIAITVTLLALLWILVILFDKKLFRPLFDQAQQVFDSEHLSRTLIETAPVGLMLIDMTSHAVLLKSVRTTEIEASLAEPSSATIVTALHQDAPHAFNAGGVLGPAPVIVELTLPAKNPTETVSLRGKVSAAHYQRSHVVVAAFSDVTMQERLKQQLIAARQAADSASEAKTLFLATMSHEIRTPLNAIIGHLELLNRAALPENHAARVKIVTSSSHTLLGIIDDILDFSKVEAGEMTFEKIRFDANALIEQAVAMFMPLAQQKALDLTYTPNAGIGPSDCLGDPVRVRQILANLIGNAIKFTEAGRVSIEVRHPKSEADLIVIDVSDTGIGIAPDSLATIFDAFMQADASVTRRFGGSGLGLALCRRLAEGMGGSISVISKVDVGSTFSLSLPIFSKQTEAPLCSPSDTQETIANIDGIRVLVAEDHAVNRELIRDQLETLGYHADIVENGLVALQYFNQQPYDLVLTDLSMPIMDGYTLTTCLRNQGSKTPIIAMTAGAIATQIQRSEEAGISDVLLKPMSLASIDAMVRKHLRRDNVAIEANEKPAGEALPDKLVQMLNEHSFALLDQAKTSLEKRDIEDVFARIHALKGSFAMIHEHTIVQACCAMEELGPNSADETLAGEIAKIHALVTQFFTQRADEKKA